MQAGSRSGSRQDPRRQKSGAEQVHPPWHGENAAAAGIWQPSAGGSQAEQNERQQVQQQEKVTPVSRNSAVAGSRQQGGRWQAVSRQAAGGVSGSRNAGRQVTAGRWYLRQAGTW